MLDSRARRSSFTFCASSPCAWASALRAAAARASAFETSSACRASRCSVSAALARLCSSASAAFRASSSRFFSAVCWLSSSAAAAFLALISSASAAFRASCSRLLSAVCWPSSSSAARAARPAASSWRALMRSRARLRLSLARATSASSSKPLSRRLSTSADVIAVSSRALSASASEARQRRSRSCCSHSCSRRASSAAPARCSSSAASSDLASSSLPRRARAARSVSCSPAAMPEAFTSRVSALRTCSSSALRRRSVSLLSFSWPRSCSTSSRSSCRACTAPRSRPSVRGRLRRIFCAHAREPLPSVWALRCRKACHWSLSSDTNFTRWSARSSCSCGKDRAPSASPLTSASGLLRKGEITKKARGVVSSMTMTRPRPTSSISIRGFLSQRNLMRSRNHEMCLRWSVLQCGFSRRQTHDSRAPSGTFGGWMNLIACSCWKMYFSLRTSAPSAASAAESSLWSRRAAFW
mmetsp:Transcript_23089/g.61016  ORF Transcript_23089/g.61016 Transcript_23089/m.61016 type:complete len:469 (+) Transcript_23089:185-1591(+)